MASILLATAMNKGLNLGLQLYEEGHIVKVCDTLPLPQRYNKLDLLLNPYSIIEQFDLVLILDVSMTEVAEAAMRAKRLTLCGGKFAHLLSSDSAYYNAVMKNIDLVPGTGTATNQLSGWFQGESLILLQTHRLSRRMMEGERGPDIGCSIIHTYTSEAELPSNLPVRLFEALNLAGYLGMVTFDLNDKNEITSIYLGLAYMHTYTFLESCRNLFDTLYHIGGKAKLKPLRSEEVLGVSFFGPANYLNTIQIEKEVEKHVHFHTEGMGCVTARGSSLNECRRRVYRTLNRLNFNPEVMYRLDAGLERDSIGKKSYE